MVSKIKETEMPRIYAPARSSALAALSLWLVEALVHRTDRANNPAPDHRLLTHPALVRGPILGLQLHGDAINPAIDLSVRKPKRLHEGHTPSDKARSYRFDPAGVAFVLAILLPGNSLYEDAKNAGVVHDLQYGDEGVSIRRVIADAGLGEAVAEAVDHRDLRRCGLQKFPFESARRNAREDIIAIALATLEKNALKMDFPLDAARYERMLRLILALLDDLPLAAPNVDVVAEVA